MYAFVFVPVHPAAETLWKKGLCWIWCSCPLLHSGGCSHCPAPTGCQTERKLIIIGTIYIKKKITPSILTETSTQSFLLSAVPAAWPPCRPPPASVVHSPCTWPGVLEPGLRPSCDGVRNPLCLASASSARSAPRSTRSPAPAWLSPPTPCSAGAAHVTYITAFIQMFVKHWYLFSPDHPSFITLLACSSCSLSSSNAWLCFCLMSAICCSWSLASSSRLFFSWVTSVSRLVLERQNEVVNEKLTKFIYLWTIYDLMLHYWMDCH